MLVFPPAKINIGLYVVGKRDDDYHNIVSVFYPICYNDAIEITESQSFRCLTYRLPIPGNVENNMVVKAYKLIQKIYNIPPVDISLIKNIPMGAGLGGGSSNATFTIHALNTTFNLGIDDDTIAKMSKQLGADCPFFAYQREVMTPAFVTGIGDKVKPMPTFLKGKHIVIVNSGIHISTKDVFSNITVEPLAFDLKSYVTNTDISIWREKVKNVFEEKMFVKQPKLHEIKNNLYKQGALYASMTGTGSSIYGIFDESLDDKNLSSYSKQFEIV